MIRRYSIKHTSHFNLKDILGEEEAIAEWTINGLPNENVSFENMIIIAETRKEKFPVIIDPEGQALRFLREQYANENYIPIKAAQSNATLQLQMALQSGSLVFCENSGDCSNPALLAIIKKELVHIQGDRYIKFND